MRSSTRLLSLVSVVAAAAALTACESPAPYGMNNYPANQPTTVVVQPAPTYGGYPSGTYQTAPVASVEYGRVTNVEMVYAGTQARTGNSTAGTVIGGVVGAALGNQIGHGDGRAAATVLGAVGGAVLGNQIAKNRDGTYATTNPVYRVTVQTDQGQWRTFDVSATGDLRVGDRVRVDNGVIYRS